MRLILATNVDLDENENENEKYTYIIFFSGIPR
jgi:hypothetical protein